MKGEAGESEEVMERKQRGGRIERQTQEKKRLGGGPMKGEAGEAEEVMERKNRVADLGEKQIRCRKRKGERREAGEKQRGRLERKKDQVEDVER